MRIKSGRDVLVWTAVITAISVAAPMLALGIPLAIHGRMSTAGFMTVMAICAAIPLMIAPPISIFALSMLRMLTITIDRLDEFVRYDTLTGVLTRAHLLDRLRNGLSAGGAFLIVDADHFKSINDTYGHDVGDGALKRLAEVLQSATPAGALVGRLGGEEFGVFLPGADNAAAADVADRLCAAMRARGEMVDGQRLDLTISIGGAVHLRSNTVEATMKLADTALYQAKRSGRDRFFIASATDTMPALILQSRSMSA